MQWEIEFYEDFETEFDALTAEVQDVFLAKALLLEQFGPGLGRPTVDTLKGSRHSNMKELRFYAGDGVWRVAFSFDPERQAILLVAGDKSGVSEKQFYKRLIETADRRFDKHLDQLRKRKKDGNDPQTKAGKSPKRSPGNH